jgi:hypothetical protein
MADPTETSRPKPAERQSYRPHAVHKLLQHMVDKTLTDADGAMNASASASMGEPAPPAIPDFNNPDRAVLSLSGLTQRCYLATRNIHTSVYEAARSNVLDSRRLRSGKELTAILHQMFPSTEETEEKTLLHRGRVVNPSVAVPSLNLLVDKMIEERRAQASVAALRQAKGEATGSALSFEEHMANQIRWLVHELGKMRESNEIFDERYRLLLAKLAEKEDAAHKAETARADAENGRSDAFRLLEDERVKSEEERATMTWETQSLRQKLFAALEAQAQGFSGSAAVAQVDARPARRGHGAPNAKAGAAGVVGAGVGAGAGSGAGVGGAPPAGATALGDAGASTGGGAMGLAFEEKERYLRQLVGLRSELEESRKEASILTDKLQMATENAERSKDMIATIRRNADSEVKNIQSLLIAVRDSHEKQSAELERQYKMALHQVEVYEGAVHELQKQLEDVSGRMLSMQRMLMSGPSVQTLLFKTFVKSEDAVMAQEEINRMTEMVSDFVRDFEEQNEENGQNPELLLKASRRRKLKEEQDRERAAAAFAAKKTVPPSPAGSVGVRTGVGCGHAAPPQPFRTPPPPVLATKVVVREASTQCSQWQTPTTKTLDDAAAAPMETHSRSMPTEALPTLPADFTVDTVDSASVSRTPSYREEQRTQPPPALTTETSASNIVPEVHNNSITSVSSHEGASPSGVRAKVLRRKSEGASVTILEEPPTPVAAPPSDRGEISRRALPRLPSERSVGSEHSDRSDPDASKLTPGSASNRDKPAKSPLTKQVTPRSAAAPVADEKPAPADDDPLLAAPVPAVRVSGLTREQVAAMAKLTNEDGLAMAEMERLRHAKDKAEASYQESHAKWIQELKARKEASEQLEKLQLDLRTTCSQLQLVQREYDSEKEAMAGHNERVSRIMAELRKMEEERGFKEDQHNSEVKALHKDIIQLRSENQKLSLSDARTKLRAKERLYMEGAERMLRCMLSLQATAACPVCLDVVRDPIVLVPCGHVMCSKCFRTSNAEKGLTVLGASDSLAFGPTTCTGSAALPTTASTPSVFSGSHRRSTVNSTAVLASPQMTDASRHLNQRLRNATAIGQLTSPERLEALAYHATQSLGKPTKVTAWYCEECSLFTVERIVPSHPLREVLDNVSFLQKNIDEIRAGVLQKLAVAEDGPAPTWVMKDSSADSVARQAQGTDLELDAPQFLLDEC